MLYKSQLNIDLCILVNGGRDTESVYRDITEVKAKRSL